MTSIEIQTGHYAADDDTKKHNIKPPHILARHCSFFLSYLSSSVVTVEMARGEHQRKCKRTYDDDDDDVDVDLRKW